MEKSNVQLIRRVRTKNLKHHTKLKAKNLQRQN